LKKPRHPLASEKVSGSKGKSMSILPPDHDHNQTPPKGWETVTLRGGPYTRHRFTIPCDLDKLTLYEGETEHNYFRTRLETPTLTHQSLVNAAFGSKGGGA
jgi:hypothetical protein